MYLAKIYVTLKPAVNDPQGQTVLGSLTQLGFVSVEDVRVGKYLEVMINESDQARAREVAAGICDKLLANPVIEEYRFDLQELPAVQNSRNT